MVWIALPLVGEQNVLLRQHGIASAVVDLPGPVQALQDLLPLAVPLQVAAVQAVRVGQALAQQLRPVIRQVGDLQSPA